MADHLNILKVIGFTMGHIYVTSALKTNAMRIKAKIKSRTLLLDDRMALK